MHLDGRIDLIALESMEFIADYQAPYLYGLVSFLLLVSQTTLDPVDTLGILESGLATYLPNNTLLCISFPPRLVGSARRGAPLSSTRLICNTIGRQSCMNRTVCPAIWTLRFAALHPTESNQRSGCKLAAC